MSNEADQPREMTLAEKIFRLAEKYREASELLKEQSRRDQTQDENYGSSGPYLLVDSFSIELYLKCLFVLDTGALLYHVHNWEELYKKLKKGTQDAIRLEYDRFIDQDPIMGNLEVIQAINPEAAKIRIFEGALKSARLTFSERRYLYEENKSKEDWYYAGFLSRAIRSVLVKDPRLSSFAKD